MGWTESDKGKADLSGPASAVLTAGGFAVTWAWTLPGKGRDAKCHQCPQLSAWRWERMERGPCLSNQLDYTCELINKCIGYHLCLLSSHISFLTSALEPASKH